MTLNKMIKLEKIKSLPSLKEITTEKFVGIVLPEKEKKAHSILEKIIRTVWHWLKTSGKKINYKKFSFSLPISWKFKGLQGDDLVDPHYPYYQKVNKT